MQDCVKVIYTINWIIVVLIKYLFFMLKPDVYLKKKVWS